MIHSYIKIAITSIIEKSFQKSMFELCNMYFIDFDHLFSHPRKPKGLCTNYVGLRSYIASIPGFLFS